MPNPENTNTPETTEAPQTFESIYDDDFFPEEEMVDEEVETEEQEESEEQESEDEEEQESDESEDEESEDEESDDEESEDDEEKDDDEDEEKDEDEDKEEKDEEDDEDKTFKIDEEDVSLADLKESYKLVTSAKEKIAEVNERSKQIDAMVTNLVEKPADALLGVFTNVFKGDGQKAYAHVVDLAEKIVAHHMQLEAMPEAEREALRLKQENERLRREAEQGKQKQQETEQQKQEREAAERIGQEIGEALTDAGYKVSDGSVSAVAEIMLKDRDLGLTTTPARAVKKYRKLVEKRKKEILASIDPDDLPDELKKELKKKEIDKLKKKKSRPKAKTGSGKQKPQRKRGSKNRVISMSEFSDVLDEDW